MSNPSHHQEIAILDFGSQYTHLIARRIRELSVLSRIYPADTPAKQLRSAVGIVLSGGPQSVLEEKIAFDKKIFTLGLPVLGLCYGHQLMAHALGGTVRPGATREYGTAKLRIYPSRIFSHVDDRRDVWMSHGDSVTQVGAGFTVVGETDHCPVAAMADEKRRLYGFQFHPEVTHSEQGMTMLRNFVIGICNARQDWTGEAVVREIEDQIRRQVGGKNVFLLVSGGVDSTVCFALLERVLGKDRVLGLHVDSGLMRYQESAKVQKMLFKSGFGNLNVVDERITFLHILKGVADPEEKRKRIGSTFLEVKERAMRKFNLDPNSWLLGQGTIYPDTIETGRTQHADVIKTHHNRVPELQELVERGEVVEPLKDLYKDEVREMGERLGIPRDLVWRHPFPGPGLGIRILCSPKKDGVNVSPEDRKEVRAVFSSLTAEAGLDEARVDLLPVRSVGVQGDQRSYRHPAVVYGTRNIDGVGRLSPMLTNKLSSINRVVLLVGGDSKDLQRASLHEAYVNEKRVKRLQKIDDAVSRIIDKAGLADIWQFPVVLLPYGVGDGESIVLRPVASREAMTVRYYRLPDKVLRDIVKVCMAKDISFVFYDLTNKPPGTIEWE